MNKNSKATIMFITLLMYLMLNSDNCLGETIGFWGGGLNVGLVSRQHDP